MRDLLEYAYADLWEYVFTVKAKAQPGGGWRGSSPPP